MKQQINRIQTYGFVAICWNGNAETLKPNELLVAHYFNYFTFFHEEQFELGDALGSLIVVFEEDFTADVSFQDIRKNMRITHQSCDRSKFLK